MDDGELEKPMKAPEHIQKMPFDEVMKRALMVKSEKPKKKSRPKKSGK